MKTSAIDTAEELSQANASVLDDLQKLEHVVLASPPVSVSHILNTLSLRVATSPTTLNLRKRRRAGSRLCEKGSHGWNTL
jgi:hypothetical protein